MIKIKFDGPEAQAELTSFYDWLQREDDVRRKAEISLAEAASSHGEMGAGWGEAVQLVLDYGFQGASLAVAYATWRATRVLHKYQMTLTTGATSVTIDADDPEAAAKIADIVAKDQGMASLPDPGQSRVVLVGVSNYQHLEALEAVANNLTDLAGELTAENVWGLPSDNCVVIPEPNSAAEMLDPLLDAAQAATDTLLFYYAGHGLTPPVGSNLHLALPGSVSGRMYTAVPYDHVREAMLKSRASRRVVILDCCYSGLALGHMGDPTAVLANEASAEGTFVLAAAAENRPAQAPAGWRNTAFTTELLEAMRHGIPDEGPLLDLDSIYRHLDQSLRAKGLPTPQKRDRNTGGQVTLIRNQAYRPPTPRHLVIVDCNNLATALWARFTGRAHQGQLFRSALQGIVADLAGRSEVQGYASAGGSPPVGIALELAEQAGLPVEVVDIRGRGSHVDLVMTAAAVNALPSLSGLTLVTGDSGFVAVIEQARRQNVATTVVSLPEALSSALAAVADNVVLLEIAEPADEPATDSDPNAAPILAGEPAGDVASEPAQEPAPELVGTAEPDVADQELADELSSMTSTSDRAFVLDALDPGQAVRILGLMAAKAAADALTAMSPARLKKVLNRATPEVIAPIIDKAWRSDQAALLTAMDPELAASVLPRLKSPWHAFQHFEPQYAIIVLSLLSSADIGRALALSPGWSISPDPLDTVLDYLQPDQVEDYLSRISPGRALKLLTARGQDRADRFFDQLEPETAASVFSEMEDEAAGAWLVRADPDRVALVLEQAGLKSATQALQRLDQQQMDLLLARMRPVQAKLLRIAMSRRPD